MPSSITTLRKPLVRRFGRMVVRIDPDGLAIRGKHKKKWRRVTWAEVARLTATIDEERLWWTPEVCDSDLKEMGAK